ncbi:eukaryotic translation initiation factor 2-alpha kinase 3-like [Babylonia areolata]|uniref:eukaryotic translation initiation factor 2-alpha kinase 3-like n=1 Tax=Babylonia areolata TaxID=304850 RepID=UPI003FD61447
MGRHRRRGWVSRFVRAVASFAAICVLCVKPSEGSPPSNEPTVPRDSASLPVSGERSGTTNTHHWGGSLSEPPSSCPSPAQTADHFLLVVSTIDGAVSALDMRTSGDLLWSVKGDDRPLLSSSITNIQVTRDGVSTRLIPSLDGGLYEFDGEDIKAIPMTAESLLSSSVRLTDNCVMVGGKEVGSYGVDVLTGQVSYQCTSNGCQDTAEAANSGGDMLLITRNLQTVRAVDVNSGSEKWNFSVGQHDLLFVRSQKDKPGIEHDDSMPEADDEDITLHSCFPTDEEVTVAEEEQLKRLIKVMVSEGLIVGLNPDDPSQMAWSRKFSSPVAKAWILHRGKLESISLFDSKVVPSLSSSQLPFQHHRNNQGDPLLYVGTHKRQLYVQREQPDPHSCEKELPWILDELEHHRKSLLQAPRVTWQPYLSKAESHTPLFLGNEPPQVPLLGQADFPQGHTEGEEGSGTLTVWHENYPFDMGYYLYPSRSKEDQMQIDLESEAEESIMDVLPASLWNWWKEVLAISLLVSLMFHIVVTYFIHPRIVIQVTPQADSGSLDKKDSKESSGSLASCDSNPALLEDRQATEFKSRFADEFECIEQLGKGGYGIVFRARNKVDEQEYAVKRIALPNRDGAVKKKMLREVRTLAMLDHGGIVRYFHSWIEDPPPGWQEERDRAVSHIMGTSDGLSPLTDTTLPSTDPRPSPLSSSHTSSAAPPPKQNAPLRQPPSLLDNIMPFRPENLDMDLNPIPRVGTGSGEFSMHSDAEGSTDESGSFSLGGGDQRDIRGDESRDSFSIQFQNSGADWSASGGGVGEEDVSCSGDPSLPFMHYSSGNSGYTSHQGSLNDLDPKEESSLSIVFEDSGNHNHNDTENRPSSESSSIVFENSCHTDNKGSSCGPDKPSKSSVLSDSSYGGSVDDTESGDPNLNRGDHVVDFTLSSQRGDVRSVADKECEKQDSAVEKKPVPKLYLYLQMQLCRLETLKDWLESNTPNRERAVVLDIFEQIVSAVDYVHAKGLIHRDLKPSNIFFALDNTVKVGDFGLVTAAENQVESSEQSPVGRASAKHTAEVGTQLYMSPEQVQKKAYDQKVDIFSLGLIFLELLMPFSTGMERVTTLQKARKGAFPEKFLREQPVEGDLVRQLTSINPQRRPTTEEILEHSLLKDLSSAPRRAGSRYRTISSCSNHSDPALFAEN